MVSGCPGRLVMPGALRRDGGAQAADASVDQSSPSEQDWVENYPDQCANLRPLLRSVKLSRDDHALDRSTSMQSEAFSFFHQVAGSQTGHRGIDGCSFQHSVRRRAVPLASGLRWAGMLCRLAFASALSLPAWGPASHVDQVTRVARVRGMIHLPTMH